MFHFSDFQIYFELFFENPRLDNPGVLKTMPTYESTQKYNNSRIHQNIFWNYGLYILVLG